MNKASNPLKRKIHIGNAEWSYVIGRTGIKVRNPDLTKTTYVQYETMYGPIDVDRMQYKRTFHVKPSDVKAYIEKNLNE